MKRENLNQIKLRHLYRSRIKTFILGDERVVNKLCYRAGIVFDEPEERTRPNPLAVVYQSGKRALSSPIPKESQSARTPNPLDRFFENGGRAPGSQPIRKPQQQAQPKPQPKQQQQVRSHTPQTPTRITPERAKNIREMRNRESGGIHTIKHRIKLREAENLLKELVRATTSTK